MLLFFNSLLKGLGQEHIRVTGHLACNLKLWNAVAGIRGASSASPALGGGGVGEADLPPRGAKGRQGPRGNAAQQTRIRSGLTDSVQPLGGCWVP